MRLSFSSRLALLIRDRADGKNVVMATLCDVDEASVRQWLKGPSLPSLRNLKKIARATGVTLDWLTADNESEISPISAFDVVTVQRLSFRASGGAGAYVLADDPGPLPLPRLLLDRIGLDPAHARIIEAVGESMRPTIGEGDFLLIETTGADDPARGLSDGQLYVFTVGDEAYVKRLTRGLHNLVMTSDNPDLPVRERPIPREETFRLVGRVRMVVKQL